MIFKFKYFLLSIASIFIIYKSVLLFNYTFYEGKIIGFETVNHRYYGFKNSGGYEKRTLNIIEYYNNNDTIKYTDGDSFIFNMFSKGEKINIIINKNNSNDIRIFSLFHYWINIQEFILMNLLLVILYGFFHVFINNKKT